MNFFAPLIAFAIAAISASTLVDGAWKRRLSTVGGWILAGAATVLAASSVTVVPTGHVKVQELFGNVTATPIVGTPSIINPFSELHTYNVQRNQLRYCDLEGFAISTVTGVRNDVDVTIVYRLNAAATPLLYREIGTQESVSSFLADTVRMELVKALTFSGPDLGADSDDLADTLEDRIGERLFQEMSVLGYNEGVSGPAFILHSVSVLPSQAGRETACLPDNNSL